MKDRKYFFLGGRRRRQTMKFESNPLLEKYALICTFVGRRKEPPVLMVIINDESYNSVGKHFQYQWILLTSAKFTSYGGKQ